MQTCFHGNIHHIWVGASCLDHSLGGAESPLRKPEQPSQGAPVNVHFEVSAWWPKNTLVQNTLFYTFFLWCSSLSKGMVRLFVWSQKSWIVAADSHSLSLYNIYTTIHPSTYVYTISDFKSFFWQIRVLSPQRCVYRFVSRLISFPYTTCAYNMYIHVVDKVLGCF